jgi:glutamate synthase domain-containing protein 3
VPPPAGDVPAAGPEATLAVPEIRDYDLVNKELARLLDAGAGRIVLAGVEGQRLLASGLRGPWSSTIVVDGHAGPELAAGLAAPGLTVVCRGDAADGAGSGLAAGRIVIEGSAAEGLGYAQAGGTIVVKGAAGHRAGLMQSGGLLVLLGSVGRLAGERQRGGLLVAFGDCLGPTTGRGQTGGRLLRLASGQELPIDDLDRLESVLLALP